MKLIFPIVLVGLLTAHSVHALPTNDTLVKSDIVFIERHPSSGTTTHPIADATASVIVQEIILQAMSLIGVRYRWGGNTPETGLDCSGFIRHVFQQSANVLLPRTAYAMSQIGQSIDRDELQPGDLVFFNTLRRQFSHVGIYLGDNRFIHAPSTGKTITVANMKQKYWHARYNGARRVNHDLLSPAITTTDNHGLIQLFSAEKKASVNKGQPIKKATKLRARTRTKGNIAAHNIAQPPKKVKLAKSSHKQLKTKRE